MNREELGKIVRQTWIDYCVSIGDTKPSHLIPWDELSEIDREADRRIGEALFRTVLNSELTAYLYGEPSNEILEPRPGEPRSRIVFRRTGATNDI